MSSTAFGRSHGDNKRETSDEVEWRVQLPRPRWPAHPGWRRAALRRLFRSDTLQELTDDDVAGLVDELRIAFVIDLRQAAEAVEEGRGPLARLSVCYANVPLVDLDSAGAPGELTATQYLDHLEHDPNLVIAVELVASVVHRPTVLHCAAARTAPGW